MSHNLSMRSLVPVLIAIAILGGCSSQPQKPVEQALPAVEYVPHGADQLLRQAASSTFPESENLKIQAANQLIDSQSQQARNILDSIDYDPLPYPLKVNLALTRAKLAEQSGQNWEIFSWLDRKAVINSPDPQIQAQAHTMRARAYNRYGEYLAAVDEWLDALPLLPDEAKSQYQDEFWNTLLHIPGDRLTTLHQQVSNRDLKGWLQLALLYRPGTALDQQIQKLEEWRQRWLGHPAEVYLPINLDSLKAEAFQQPGKVALLLPINGPLAPAGRAVRDGFIAAFYQSAGKQQDSLSDNTPEIMILDTSKGNISDLVYEARSQGAELIIGPLDKSSVQELSRTPNPGVPILALNYTGSDSGPAPETSPNQLQTPATDLNFFQYGLSTEDEARMAAKRGLLDGHQRAILLTPDSSWGRRAANSFTEEWLKGGGELAGKATFAKDTEFSKLAGEVLQVEQSQQRARQLNRLLRSRLGFEPRRRQDVDMIFMPANPQEARQMKPALSYQFAGNIPVYSTSTAFSGATDQSRDQDLNNLRIPIMHWYIPNNSNPLEKEIISIWPGAKSQYGSLYAMGADAFHLYPRLHQLASLPGSRIEGLTGWLSIDSQGRVVRELSWQIFRNGRLSPLPIADKHALATQSLE
ncbi:MAG: penicillin-binding protein activator [Endozoicomonas sp.]